MVGIVKKVNQQGQELLLPRRAKRFRSFGRTWLNPHQTGERVVFSLRIAKGKMFGLEYCPNA